MSPIQVQLFTSDLQNIFRSLHEVPSCFPQPCLINASAMNPNSEVVSKVRSNPEIYVLQLSNEHYHFTYCMSRSRKPFVILR